MAYAAFPVFAQNSSNDNDIPERDGVYNVPKHPNMKVRVFVHKQKPQSQPSATPAPLACGLDAQDINSQAVTPATPWHLKNGAWNYYLNLGSVPSGIGSANLVMIANNAFATWAATNVGHSVTFNNIGNTTINRKAFDGKNIIAWGRTSQSALAVTYTWYYTATNEVAEEDTIFNKQYPWSWSGSNTDCANPNSYDTQDILTHELGHWMGLDDTYAPAYVNNTMYGYGSRWETKKDTLTDGDISGIAAIYP